MHQNGSILVQFADGPWHRWPAHASLRQKEREPGEEARELAGGLLEIAAMTMPDTYYYSDSRCERARKVLSAMRIAEPEARMGRSGDDE